MPLLVKALSGHNIVTSVKSVFLTLVKATIESSPDEETIMMGRTHGVHAEPTTFGLKLATWYSEMKRNIERFELAAKGVEAGKISGAVGNFANIPPFV